MLSITKAISITANNIYNILPSDINTTLSS